jgi:hypothetical protein
VQANLTLSGPKAPSQHYGKVSRFWMYCREDLRKLKRIILLWDYIRSVTDRNAALLMGTSRRLQNL